MKRRMLVLVLLSVIEAAACGVRRAAGFEPYDFQFSTRQPRQLSSAEIRAAAQRGLRPGENIASTASFAAPGIGHTVVQVVTQTIDDSRAYIVDEDGQIVETQLFWAEERAARIRRFGKLTPSLFQKVSQLDSQQLTTVDVMVYADLPEPELPYDGTDRQTSIEEYEEWTRSHSDAQVARIAQAKQRLITFFDDQGAVVLQNPRGLPTIRARLSSEMLQSQALNDTDVVTISEADSTEAHLLGYAGIASMQAAPSSGGLTGGACSGGVCDGIGLDVGYWERDAELTISGVARNNSRVATNVVSGYLDCPQACSSDAQCPATGGTKLSCREPTAGAAKICVQDHLTWTVASVGMFGSYSYDTFVPGGTDPVANASTLFASSGAWNTDKRFGNRNDQLGLDYLIAPPPGQDPCETATQPPTLFINRSVDQTPNVSNFPARAFGTFLTAASGNSESGPVTCARLKNGLCVGSYDYFDFGNQGTHRRSVAAGGAGSSFLNDLAFDSTLERPHLLGPGAHQPNISGLHMPAIDVAPGSSLMRHADYSAPAQAITGTSFAAPAVLSIAIQALHHEGLFSSMAHPQVNKAVLMAATRDANVDGTIGKSTTWSANAPTLDAEDGAGQINIATLSSILTNNSYLQLNLQDSSFTSCGAGCRKYTVTTQLVGASNSFRAALAWHSCMINEGDLPVLNNDLDLALACSGPPCPGTIISNTVTSETEMLERNSCVGQPKTAVATCSLEIRIKNGASLQPCGSTTFERVGIAWRKQ